MDPVANLKEQLRLARGIEKSSMEAIRKAYALHEEWVSMQDIREGRGYDLDRIHASMLAEHRANLTRPARCTPACARETRGKLVLLGKIRKVLL